MIFVAQTAARYLFDTSSELAGRFREDGYLIIPDAIDLDLLTAVRSSIEEKLAALPFDSRPNLPGFSFDTGRFQDAWRIRREVADLAGSEKILGTLEELYGAEAHPFQTLNFTVGAQQRAHPDHIHFSSRPLGFMCGVWIALEDVTEENGPLFYYLGSHNLPYMSYAELGIDPSQFETEPEAYVEYETAMEKLAESRGFKRQIFTAKKGDALIWAANLVHGGSPVKREGSTRWSQVTYYLFENCVHYTPRLSDEMNGELFVRAPVDIRTGLPIASPFTKPNSEPHMTASPAHDSTDVEPQQRDDEIDRLNRQVQRLRTEIDAIHSTRLFRYTRGLRRVYSKLRSVRLRKR